ncbi:LAQU0S31e00232g1_1 [Lachancea quebecensis]|uniref:LAQU0S31e00232g1_1 n=1 Tax=Lachancea quebecensis TaxID=1654605 RepID=A0A0P1L421_9SACH|nr:LAQU0S31e00232g1_1 [Lachancea quebecensis]
MATIRYRSVRKHPKEGVYVKHTERRSKSGCFTCRHRRKKCDEARPRCGGCTRNMLDCSWPSSFINEYSPALKNRDKDSNPTGSSVRAPQDGLEKPFATMPRPLGRKFAFKKLAKFSSILKLTDGTLCEAKDDSQKILQQFPKSQRPEPVIACNQEEHRIKIKRGLRANRVLNGENTLKSSKKTETLENDSPHFKEIEGMGYTKVPSQFMNTINSNSNFANDNEITVRSQPEDERSFRDFFDLQLTPLFYFKSNQFEGSSSDSKITFLKHHHDLPEIKEHSTKLVKKCRNREKPSVQFRNGTFEINERFDTEKYRKILDCYNRGEPDVNISTENYEALLLHTCVEKFIPNLGTQYTHPLLTACATFVPQAEKSIPLREVFLCCGATYLEWYDDAKFTPLSNSLYKSSHMLIEKYLHNESLVDAGPWLLASFQLLSLRSKMASSGSVDDCVQCLSKSYLVIQKTILMRNNEHAQTAAGLQNLNYEIENKFMRQQEQKEQDKIASQPYERMYIESFIYNYSVTILFATNLSRLPSPFCIFKEISHVLKRPIYCCHFEWMNNPVLGPALDAFEILAKVSYIGRLPMPLSESSVWFQRAGLLKTMAFFYTSPVLSLQVKSNDKQLFENAKLSALVGIIVAKSSYLLVSKILNFDGFQVQHAAIRKVRFEIFEAFSLIPLGSNIWGILVWSLVITGCFSTTVHERSQTLKYLLNVGEHFHHQNTIAMRKFLEKAWSCSTSKHLDILFDRRELSKIAP